MVEIVIDKVRLSKLNDSASAKLRKIVVDQV